MLYVQGSKKGVEEMVSKAHHDASIVLYGHSIFMIVLTSSR